MKLTAARIWYYSSSIPSLITGIRNWLPLGARETTRVVPVAIAGVVVAAVEDCLQAEATIKWIADVDAFAAIESRMLLGPSWRRPFTGRLGRRRGPGRAGTRPERG